MIDSTQTTPLPVATPRESHPRPAPSFPLPGVDEADLSWYFGPGATVFERSMFGAQMQMAETASYESSVCPACDGKRFTELSAEQIEARKPEIKAELEEIAADPDVDNRSKRLSKFWADLCNKTACKLCSGKGRSERRMRRKNGRYDAKPGAFASERCRGCRGTGYDRVGDPCEQCDGLGHGYPVTVFSTQAGQGDEPSWTPDDWALIRYARVARRVSLLTALAAETLELFYGDHGARYGATRQGRILAVFELTPSGARLAKRGLSADERTNQSALARDGLRVDEAIYNQCEAQSQKYDATRAEIIIAARRQSEALLDRAATEWRATAPRKRRPHDDEPPTVHA